MEKELKNEHQTLEEIKAGNSKILETLYHEHRKQFIAWAVQNYQCPEEDSVEIYQKAFTAFYFNVRNGKLTTLTSTIKTYLFSIGKNLMREKLRDKHNHHIQLDDVANSNLLDDKIDTSMLDQQQHSHQREVVRMLLEQIGDPCRRLLHLIFIQGYSVEAVVKEMGYSDERVVRKRKSLCLKQMRELAASKKNSNLL